MRALLDPVTSQPANSLARLSGSRFAYDYQHLARISDHAKLASYILRTRTLFSPTARSFDDALNTEWALRSYLALKLILHSTIFGTSALYSERQNLQAALPYLSYYTLFGSCRAFLLTCPDLSWTGSNTARFSHTRARTLTTDLLRRLDPDVAAEASDVLLTARRQRELFSYSFPMSGFRGDREAAISVDRAISWAGVFAELAHLNTACLEGSVAKLSAGESYRTLDDDAWELMHHPLEGGGEHFDEGDWAWLARLFRSHTTPVALTALVTEGMIDDFFGAWADPNDEENAYSPDEDWRILLDLW